MIYYIDSNGNITGNTDTENIDSITALPRNSAYALHLDDTSYPDVQSNQSEWRFQSVISGGTNKYNIPIVTGTPINVPIPDATKLQNYQNIKISQLKQSLTNALATFQSSALTTTYTYLNDDNSRTLLASEYAFVRSSDYDNSNVDWYTVEQGRLSHTGAQIAQVFLDGRKWTANQYSHYDSLVKQVQAVTLTNQSLAQGEAQIDTIVW